MARPTTWFRLARGRVWHVRQGSIDEFAELALCGAADYSGEQLEDAPPVGGKPCPECLAAAEAIVLAGIDARAMWEARRPFVGTPDPRTEDVGAEVL